MDDEPGSAGATSLLDALRRAVARHALLQAGDRVLVAVSGGPDSVALLHALTLLRSEYALTLGVCHVHHGLRPEADRDARFVQALGEGLGCPVTVERVRVPLGGGRSPEQAARAARYVALARAGRAFGATRIALGHTADDQAETVLMRLCQGAGPRGLAGIPVRRGRLVRPLLEVDRASVLGHLAAHGLAYVEDATNRDPKFLRNRIRHELLPLLAAQAGPRLREALGRVARTSRETVEALDALICPTFRELVEPRPGGWAVDLAGLAALPSGAAKALLRLALGEVAPAGALTSGLRGAHLDALHALLEARPGARVRLPGGVVVERARGALWIARPAARLVATALRVPGTTVIADCGLTLEADTRPGPWAGPPDSAWEAWFDADALAPELAIRPRRPGDRIIPFGGDRAVRVGRLLAAAGVPRLARADWPVLVGRDGDAEAVLWVIGVRRGAAAPVMPGARAMVRVRARSGEPGANVRVGGAGDAGGGPCGRTEDFRLTT